jgi:hypothetical protein
MPRQNAESTTLKTRSKDVHDGFAGREHLFAEQEQRIKSVAAFLCSVSLHQIPERHPPLAFELGQLNRLDRRVTGFRSFAGCQSDVWFSRWIELPKCPAREALEKVAGLPPTRFSLSCGAQP